MTCLLFPVLSQLALAGDGGKRLLNKVGEKKKIKVDFFMGFMLKKVRSKVETSASY